MPMGDAMERVAQVAVVDEATKQARRARMAALSASIRQDASDLREAEALGASLSRATVAQTMTADEFAAKVGAED